MIGALVGGYDTRAKIDFWTDHCYLVCVTETTAHQIPKLSV
jgi:hypothetical protein